MGQVKMGFDQLNNPTPSKLNLWVRIFTVAAGIFLLWMETAPFIGPVTQSYLNSILGLLLALCNGLAPLFGIEVTQKSVPADKVTAMDPPDKQ